MFPIWPECVFTQTILSGVVILIIAYTYLNWPYNIFRRLGVPGPKPLPFVGNFTSVEHLGKKDLSDFKKYGKVFGAFEGWTPVMKIADLDTIKKIMVQEFHNFQDHRRYPMKGIVGNSLFDSTGDTWKLQRAMLSPYFSSGKLKMKVPLILENADNSIDVLSTFVESKESFEAKHFANCFTMDSIASSLFGLKVNAYSDPDNPFVKHGEGLVKAVTLGNPFFIIMFLAPVFVPFLEMIGVSIFPSASVDFFTELTKKSIASREEAKDQNKTPDIAQALIKFHEDEVAYMEEIKQSGETIDSNVKRRGMTMDEIIAQGILVFAAGYDTSATVLSFLFYHLAIYPDIQEKLYQEIESTFPSKESPSYEGVMGLEYLEMCFCETLRIYPPVVMTDRKCNSDITINDTFIPKDMIVEIPLWALHNDPEYWPDPEKFDPERFSKDTSAERNPYLFMPFGTGPRSCLGMRLAQLAMKIAAVRFLQHFKFTRTDKTEVPLNLEYSFFIKAKNGIWLGVEKRDG